MSRTTNYRGAASKRAGRGLRLALGAVYSTSTKRRLLLALLVAQRRPLTPRRLGQRPHLPVAHRQRRGIE
eukprot:5853020-Pyramimonas_sp.AAC.1